MISLSDVFGAEQVMVILRGLPPTETVAAAHMAWDAGVELVEVPIGGTGDVASLAAAVRAGAERGKTVGAGTVITREQVAAAARAGATYTVAPGYDPEIAAASMDAGMPHLPGAATPSEVQRAYVAGLRWVKLYPAATLGPAWIRAIRGPFPDVHLVVTGGITPQDAEAYYQAGARILAFGAALIDPAQRGAFLQLVAKRRSSPRGVMAAPPN